MAKQDQKGQHVDAYTVDGNEGWVKVRTLEDERALVSEQTKNISFISYSVRPNDYGAEITAHVFIPGLGQSSNAEWFAKMAIKQRHANVWKEIAMATAVEGGFDVAVRWFISNGKRKEHDTGNLSF